MEEKLSWNHMPSFSTNTRSSRLPVEILVSQILLQVDILSRELVQDKEFLAVEFSTVDSIGSHTHISNAHVNYRLLLMSGSMSESSLNKVAGRKMESIWNVKLTFLQRS